MKKLILLLMAICLVACGPMPEHKRHHKHKKAVVHKYDFDVNLDGIADLFEYVIKDGNGCYLSKSSTPVSNFTNVQWTRLNLLPPELVNEEEDGKLQIEEPELEEDLQADMNENPDSFEDADGDSGGDGGSDDGGGDSGGDGGGGGGD